METKFRIGISSCLLGNEVRWNSGHKLDKYLAHTLGQFVEYVPVCPEVEAGFGVPRESFRLVGDPKNPRLVTFKSKTDRTDRMLTWAKKRVKELAKEDLYGFIFKSDSPSSGMIRVKVYNEKGMPHKVGIGIFARAFMEHFPLVPVEDDGRLNDPLIRENFILQIFTMKRWRDNLARKPNMGNLVDFHTRNKLLIMSHSPKHYRLMGKLVADGKKMAIKELHQQYQLQLMDALKLKTTIKKHINVLQHVMGYFKKQLTGDEKQELLEVFDHYRGELVPLIGRHPAGRTGPHHRFANAHDPGIRQRFFRDFYAGDCLVFYTGMSIHPTRLKSLNEADARKGDYVLYWMQQSQRAVYNHALEFAIQQANKLDRMLLVVFGLMDDYPEANPRHYTFMLEGLKETRAALASRGIKMILNLGHPPEVALSFGS